MLWAQPRPRAPQRGGVKAEHSSAVNGQHDLVPLTCLNRRDAQFLHGSGRSCGGRKDRKYTHRPTACRGDWSPVPAQNGDSEQVGRYGFYACSIIAPPPF